jgi:hypothetical protein
MLRSKLKYYYIQKKIHSLSLKSQSSADESTKKIKTVGIISCDNFSKKYDFSEILIQKFSLRNPKIYSFRKFSKDDQKSYKHFSEKDFDWRGDILDTSLSSFLEEPFDLLICLYTKKNIFLEYAVATSAASFKVGLSNINTGFFHLDITCDANQIDVFFDEMKKYLAILNKHT